MRSYLVPLLALAMAPWAGLHAQSTPDTQFKVTATVNAVCTITASDLAFGSYTSSGPELAGSTVLKATCTPATTYNIGLDAGTSTGATVLARKMASGANTLNYQLYSDSGRVTVWGNTTGTDTVEGVGTGLPIDHVVYGTIPASQNVAAGNYEDTITATVYY